MFLFMSRIMEVKENSRRHAHHQKRQMLERIPVIMAVICLCVATMQIVLSVFFLVECKHTLHYLISTLRLNEAPCYHLVTPSYLGCIVIFITIFGLCCLGRKATAIMFFLVAIFGTIYGFYVFVCKNCSSNQNEIFQFLNATISQCHQNENIDIQSWKLVNTHHVPCSKTANWTMTQCLNTSVVNKDSHSLELIQQCSSDMYGKISETLNFYMQFEFSIILFTSGVYIFVCILLFYTHNASVKLTEILEADGEVLTELQTNEAMHTKHVKFCTDFKFEFKWCFPKISNSSKRNNTIEEL